MYNQRDIRKLKDRVADLEADLDEMDNSIEVEPE